MKVGLILFAVAFPLLVAASFRADESEASAALNTTKSAAPQAADDAAAPPAAEKRTTLSAEPPRVIYPEDRPDWVDASPSKVGERERIAVSSGPHYSLGEARRQLAEAIRTAADEYVDHHLGVNNASRYIRYEVQPIVTFEERPEFSFGPMHQAHALLEFDEAFRRQIEEDWKEALTFSRLLKIGLGSGALFVLLAVLLGYLKAEHVTRGVYTRRLRFAAATVILALVAAIFFAASWFPWI